MGIIVIVGIIVDIIDAVGTRGVLRPRWSTFGRYNGRYIMVGMMVGMMGIIEITE